MDRRYWRFYWPLLLMALAMLVARQVQNRTLASYEEAAREIAAFALAFATFGFFNAALVFVPHMVNILARNPRSLRRCALFTLAIALLLTAPVAFLAFTATGAHVLRIAFGIEEEMLVPVTGYLRLAIPLMTLTAFAHFYTGLLVQSRRTGVVTVLQCLKLAGVCGMLLTGWRLGWSPVLTLSLSQLAPTAAHLALAAVATLFVRRPLHEPETLRWRDILHYYWPTALTSVMFSLSRPILLSFLNRTPDSEASVAGLALAFGFAMIFHAPVNQFRHLFATFGREDLPGVRRFLTRVMWALVAALVAVNVTPLGWLAFRYALNARGELLNTAVSAFAPLCLIPVVVTLRNYYHGLALVRRRTRGMGAGGVTRNAAIYLAALALFRTQGLNAASAACVLVIGFIAETATVYAEAALTSARENGSSGPRG